LANSKTPREAKTFVRRFFEVYPNLKKQFAFYLTGDTTKPTSKLLFGDFPLKLYAREELKYGGEE
jgi:hypothetical protein